MGSYADFIKPELLVLVPVLIFIGKILCDSVKVDSTWIPVILGIVGVVFSALWVMATSEFTTSQDVFMGIFVILVQGLLCAGAAVYGNQIFKQTQKRQTMKRQGKSAAKSKALGG